MREEATMAAEPKTFTAELLDDLWKARAEVIAMEGRKQDALDALLTPEIRERMQAIEAQFEGPMIQAREMVEFMEEKVRDRVLGEGCSTKGEHLHAIWVKGRVTWDGKGLDGYSKAQPEILAFRSEGSPSVSIRGITK